MRQQWGSFLSALTHRGFMSISYQYESTAVISLLISYNTDISGIPYHGYHITLCGYHTMRLYNIDCTSYLYRGILCATLISCNLVLLSYPNGITSDIYHIVLPRYHTILISSHITLIFYQYWTLSRHFYPFHAIIKILVVRGQENYCRDHGQWYPYSLSQQAITNNGFGFIKLIYLWRGGGVGVSNIKFWKHIPNQPIMLTLWPSVNNSCHLGSPLLTWFQLYSQHG